MRRLRQLQPIAVLLAALPCTPAAAERFDHAVPMQQEKSGNYYVHGVLGDDVETDFLVDTGSGYVSLSRKTFARVKRGEGVEYLRDIVGVMANGQVMKVPVYRISQLILGACLLADIEAAVFPGEVRDILGLSALRKIEPFAMQLTPPMLLVSDCGGPGPRTARRTPQSVDQMRLMSRSFVSGRNTASTTAPIAQTTTGYQSPK